MFAAAKLSLRTYVNVAFTLMSILLKLACVSISRTIEFVIIGGRIFAVLFRRFVFHPNTLQITLGGRSSVNLEIMIEVLYIYIYKTLPVFITTVINARLVHNQKEYVY